MEIIGWVLFLGGITYGLTAAVNGWPSGGVDYWLMIISIIVGLNLAF